jgi:anti-sigma-K factor RskA
MYDDAQDAVAAEYVLGTLSADERQHAEALLAIDPGFAEAVRTWERRLGELNVMVEAVEPPAHLWDKIRANIGEAAFSKETPPSVAALVAPTRPEPQEKAPSGIESLPQVAPAVASLSPLSADQPVERIAEPTTATAPPPPPPPPLAPTPVESLHAPSPSAPAAKIERSAEVVYLARRVGHWRRMTGALGAIAALLAIFVAVTLFAPGLIPLARLSSGQVTAGSTSSAPLGARLVAVLQQEPTAPAFLLTIDPQNGTLTVRRVTATPETGRSYELWLISNRFPAPRSLGVIGDQEFTQRPIPSGFDVDTMRAASYAVSLEPAGGSQRGVPSGPILFTGKMVESVPAPAPPQPRT